MATPIHNDANHPAVIRLREFFEAVNAWGYDLQAQYDEIDWENATQQFVDQIFGDAKLAIVELYRRYCEAGDNAERLQDEWISFSRGMQFDERVTSVKVQNDVVIVTTKENSGAEWLHRYELVPVGGEWMIRDNRQFASEFNKRWKADLL